MGGPCVKKVFSGTLTTRYNTGRTISAQGDWHGGDQSEGEPVDGNSWKPALHSSKFCFSGQGFNPGAAFNQNRSFVRAGGHLQQCAKMVPLPAGQTEGRRYPCHRENQGSAQDKAGEGEGVHLG